MKIQIENQLFYINFLSRTAFIEIIKIKNRIASHLLSSLIIKIIMNEINMIYYLFQYSC